MAALTSLLFYEIKWNGLLRAKGVCYPGHGAPFNVLSDGEGRPQLSPIIQVSVYPV